MSIHDPKPLGDPVKHYWLARSMAAATGVDLAAAYDEGRLTQDDWAEMNTRCRGCDWERDGACGRWLSFHEDPGSAKAPQTCDNADVFTRLRAGETATEAG